MGSREVDGTRKDLIQGGIACGLLLFAASSLQQMGIQYTTAGKAGFITAFYIAFVPVLGIFLKKAAGWKVWMSVFLALIGLYFLCIKEGFSIGKGDIMIFACALVFAVHILVIDYYSPKVDGARKNVMYPVLCVWNCITAVYVPDRNAANWKYIRCPDADFICGSHVLWGGIYITNPRTEACESGDCITAFKYGILFFCTFRLDNIRRNTVREGIGCVLMFVAIILAQLPDKREKWAGIKGLCKYKRQERENEIRNSESVRK